MLPGKAKTLEELRIDLDKAVKKRQNSSLGDFWTGMHNQNFVSKNSSKIFSTVTQSYFSALSKNGLVNPPNPDDIKFLIDYCNGLAIHLTRVPEHTLTTTQVDVLTNILSAMLVLQPSTELFTAFKNIINYSEVLGKFVSDGQFFWRLSTVDLKQTGTNLTALELLLNEWGKYQNPDQLIEQLAQSLLANLDKEKIGAILDKLNAIPLVRRVFYAYQFKEKLEKKLIEMGFQRQSPETVEVYPHVASDDDDSLPEYSSTSSDNRDSLLLIVKSLAYSSARASDFSEFLLNAKNVKQILEDPDLLYFLSLEKNKNAFQANNIDGNEITKSRKHRIGLLRDAIVTLKNENKLTESELKVSLSILGRKLINSEEREAVIINAFKNYSFKVSNSETGLAFLQNIINNEKLTVAQQGSKNTARKEPIGIVGKETSAQARSRHEAARTQNFTKLLSSNDIKELTHGCEQAFTFSYDNKPDNSQREIFFTTVLGTKDNPVDVNENLEKLAAALMFQTTSVEKRNNFWKAVTVSDADAIPSFSVEHRITLVGHLLDDLTENFDKVSANQENAIKFIFEQLKVARGENQLKDLFPVLFKASRFNTLATLYNNSPEGSEVRKNLTSIFKACYISPNDAPNLHDALYKAGLEKNWEFLVRVNRKDDNQFDGKEKNWGVIARNKETQQLVSKNKNTELQSREVQDYLEKKYQNECKTSVWSATKNLMNDKFPDNGGWVFWLTVGAYFIPNSRPLPAYKTAKDSIKIQNDAVGCPEFVEDVKDNDTVTLNSVASEDVVQPNLYNRFARHNTPNYAQVTPGDVSPEITAYKSAVRGKTKTELVAKINNPDRLVELFVSLSDKKVGKRSSQQERFIRDRKLTEDQIIGMYKSLSAPDSDVANDADKTRLVSFIRKLDLKKLIVLCEKTDNFLKDLSTHLREENKDCLDDKWAALYTHFEKANKGDNFKLQVNKSFPDKQKFCTSQVKVSSSEQGRNSYSRVSNHSS